MEGRVPWPLPFSSLCSILQLRGRNSERDELGEPFEPRCRKGHLFSSSGLFILFTCPVMTGATCSPGTKRVFSEVWGRIRSSAIDKPQLASFHPVNKRPCACTVAPLSPAASKPGQAPPISHAHSSSSAELCFLVQMQLRTLHMVFEHLRLALDSPRAARHFFQEHCSKAGSEFCVQASPFSILLSLDLLLRFCFREASTVIKKYPSNDAVSPLDMVRDFHIFRKVSLQKGAFPSGMENFKPFLCPRSSNPYSFEKLPLSPYNVTLEMPDRDPESHACHITQASSLSPFTGKT